MDKVVSQLQQCLEQEVDLVGAFIEILKAEAQVLTEVGDIDALSETTEKKNQYADQLMMVGDERQGLLTRLGFSEDKAGLQAAADAYPALSTPCQALLEKAQLASDLNASNGKIIDTFLGHNQQALDTLRNLTGAGNLYDASGRANRGGKGASKTFKAG
ncbi:flagellar protein FlgN [Candidimonas sp. SYP-B2681]|uniref:flagella synthesis protein FlgN n=1 Tax=Candidimonas sp. SYP-B2681 TaxID=2497686 RepID=UPI000F86CB62|nr:flagellar protein FlgN [Candidimonas sp. SYP-B2681]RTZ47538.1 flagellar protein FlgN [Candidimonas sp. SYP-B2681]